MTELVNLADFRGIAKLYGKRKPKRWPGHKPDWYFYFTLIAPNNEPIAQSEQYTTKQSAIDVLDKYFPEFHVIDMNE